MRSKALGAGRIPQAANCEQGIWLSLLAGGGIDDSHQKCPHIEAAVVAQIQAIAAADQNFPNSLGTASRTYAFVFYDQGTPVPLQFRVYFVANGSATIPGAYISVGTIY